MDRSIAETEFVVVDVETTGLGVVLGARVIEVALLTTRGSRAAGIFTSLVSCGEPIPPDATAVHGLDEADLEGAPTFEEIADEICSRVEGRVLVAHNAPFDLTMLQAECALAGRRLPRTPVLDTLRLARRLLDAPGFSLDALADTLGLRARPGHRALADARCTAALLRRLAAEVGGSTAPVARLFEAQGGDRWRDLCEARALRRGHPVRRAIEERRSLDIVYVDEAGRKTRRRVRPLFVRRGRLVAHCELRGARRTFLLDRIRRARCARPIEDEIEGAGA